MSRVVVVTSGKGGVGKTTSTASLGAALAQSGDKVVLVDFDVGLRNLDLVLGAERRVVYDLVNVVQGMARLSQALITDKRLATLSLLPASQTRDKDALTEEGISPRNLGNSEPIRLDNMRQPWYSARRGAGYEIRRRGHRSDQSRSFFSAPIPDRIIGLLDWKTEKAERGERVDKHLLVTRFNAVRAGRGEMLSIEDVLEILSTPFLGIIPESEEVLKGSNVGCPVVLNSPSSASARAYADAARRLKGENIAMSVPSERTRLFEKLFGRRAA